MPLTNRSAQLVDPLLTNLGRKYTPAGFIADRVCPRVQVVKESGLYPVWTRDDFHRTDVDPLVADRAKTKRIDFRAATEPYVCEEYALATDISRRERDYSADVLRLRAGYAELAEEWMRHGERLADVQRAFDRSIVDGLQQTAHDLFWDTTWPACPRHPNHPLWFQAERDAWCCPRDGSAIARLGELAKA